MAKKSPLKDLIEEAKEKHNMQSAPASLFTAKGSDILYVLDQLESRYIYEYSFTFLMKLQILLRLFHY